VKSIGLCNPDKWQSAFTVNLADKVYKVLTHPFRRILHQKVPGVLHHLQHGPTDVVAQAPTTRR
jgi:hypothetical protein